MLISTLPKRAGKNGWEPAANALRSGYLKFGYLKLRSDQMTLLSRRDVGKILVAGSTHLALGAQSALGALSGSAAPAEAQAQGGNPQPPPKSGSSQASVALDASQRAAALQQ